MAERSGQPARLESKRMVWYCWREDHGTISFRRNSDWTSIRRIPAHNSSRSTGRTPLALVRDLWFQQDGCPAHWHRMAQAAADLLFPGKWIGRGGPVAWPPRSPDLTPLDFLLWGVIKEIVYRLKPTTRQDMKRRIREAIRSLDPAQSRRATRSVRKRAQKCIEAHGQYFEHKL